MEHEINDRTLTHRNNGRLTEMFERSRDVDEILSHLQNQLPYYL